MNKQNIKLGIITTVYNESKFLKMALRSVYPYVDYISVFEGAYSEVIQLGKAPHSTDGTLEIISEIKQKDIKNKIIYNNSDIFRDKDHTDKDHRTEALYPLLERGCDFIGILDGDEYWPKNLIDLIYHYISMPGIDCYYLKSQTFINDFFHYTWQQFPRLFRVKPKMEFCDDNFVRYYGIEEWPDVRKGKIDLIPYAHFSFVKDRESFKTKKLWWETRFKKEVWQGEEEFGGSDFHYDWDINSEGKIVPENHTIYKLNKLPRWLEQELRKDGKL